MNQGPTLPNFKLIWKECGTTIECKYLMPNFLHSLMSKVKRNVKKFTKKSYTVKQLKSSCFSFLGCELINISPFFRLSHALELLRDVFSTNFNQQRNRSKRKKKNCYAKVNINPGPTFTNLSTFKGYSASKSNANKRSTNMKKNY